MKKIENTIPNEREVTQERIRASLEELGVLLNTLSPDQLAQLDDSITGLIQKFQKKIEQPKMPQDPFIKNPDLTDVFQRALSDYLRNISLYKESINTAIEEGNKTQQWQTAAFNMAVQGRWARAIGILLQFPSLRRIEKLILEGMLDKKEDIKTILAITDQIEAEPRLVEGLAKVLPSYFVAPKTENA